MPRCSARARTFRSRGWNDHAGIRNGNADARDNLFKQRVGKTVVEYIRVDVVGALDARHAYGVRTDAVHRLEMLSVHQQTGKFVSVLFQAEQHAQTNVIDTASIARSIASVW